jgi:hypothetical protein
MIWLDETQVLKFFIKFFMLYKHVARSFKLIPR